MFTTDIRPHDIRHTNLSIDTCLRDVGSPDALCAIHDPSCAATVWRRTALPDFQDWIDRLPSDQLPCARMILRPNQVRDAIEQAARRHKMPACAEREALLDDMEALATTFATVMRTRYLRLRLDVITDNACRKFHVDMLTARLICTYRGQGTQYGVSPDGGEPKIVRSVPTGSPIVLRGSQWPETPRSGFLHRSPPIEGTHETRLLLVLDPVADPENEPDPIFKTRHYRNRGVML